MGFSPFFSRGAVPAIPERPGFVCILNAFFSRGKTTFAWYGVPAHKSLSPNIWIRLRGFLYVTFQEDDCTPSVAFPPSQLGQAKWVIGAFLPFITPVAFLPRQVSESFPLFALSGIFFFSADVSPA